MKKTIVVLLTLAFVLSFSSCKSGAKLSGNTKLIPEGTNAIAEINVSDFMKLAKIKKEVEKEGEKFTKMTGIKPSDVKSITFFATVDKLRDLQRKPDFGFLVEGSGFTKDIFKNVPKSFTQIKYADTTIYDARDMAMALNGKTVVGGTVDNTKKILDLGKGKGKAANVKEFAEIFAKLKASSAKGAVVVPKSTRDELAKMKSPMPVGGLTEVMQNLEVFAMGANVSSSSIEVKLVLKSDAKGVKALATSLDGLLKMFGAQAAGMDKKMPGAKEAFDSIKINADGKYLTASVTIPAKMLDKM
jgi:hypothetical protein